MPQTLDDAFAKENAVNVCHDDGPVVAFRDHWQSRHEPRAASHDASWIAYCRVREREERARAKNARSIEARRIHQKLAQKYARLALQRAKTDMRLKLSSLWILAVIFVVFAYATWINVVRS